MNSKLFPFFDKNARNATAILRPFLMCVAAFVCLQANAQHSLSGEVHDAEGPLPGATVLVKEVNLVATTDFDGKFTLNNLPLGKHVLVVSFMGFRSQEIMHQMKPGKNQLPNVVKLELDVNILQEVAVSEKMEEGEEKAILIQQRSLNLSQVVSSDGIERLPDKNAAEAMQRMPGVVMESDQGEGTFISFRGTPTDWGSSLVNGDRLPVANEEDVGRSFSMDILPTSLIEYIQYNQNLSPSIEGDAIGGSANFITKYVPEKPTLDLQAGYGHNYMAGKPLWNASLLMGKRFGKDKKWGVAAGGSIYQRNWGTDNYELFYSNNDNHNIERLELRRYDGERTTYGAHGRLDYHLNKNNTIYALGFFGRMDDQEYNRKTMYNWVAGVGQSIVIQNIHNKRINDIYGLNVGGNHTINEKLSADWKLAYYATDFRYGPSGVDRGSDKNGYYVVEFEKLVRFKDYLYVDQDGNRSDEVNAYARFKLLDIDSPFSDYGTPANNIAPQYENITPVKSDDTLFTHKKTYSEIRHVHEKDPIVASADFRYKWSKNFNVRFGAKARNKEGYRTYSMVSWIRDPQIQNSAFRYNENELSDINRQDKYLSREGGYYQPYTEQFMSNSDMQSWIDRYDGRLLYLPFGPTTTEIYKQFIGNNYNYNEQVYAGYVAANYDVNAKTKIDFGVRVEDTHVGITGLNSKDSTYFDMSTGQAVVLQWLTEDEMQTNYLAVLPMVNINHKINKKSSLRSSITRSFRRPNFNELKPGQPDIHYTHFHALYGNPDLKPTFAWNADLSYQKYIGLSDVLTVTGYYKYVTNHIFTSFRSDELNVSGVSNTFRPPGGILAKEYRNAPYAHVGGFEITYQKKLTFLPGVFKHTSVSVNYAFTESKMRIQAREKLQPLPRQARNIFNARLSYDTKKLNINVALNYRDPYLAELNLIAVKDPETGKEVVLNQDNDFDMFVGKNLGLDASVNYNINDKLSVYAEVNNLLNTPYTVYRGVKERPMQTEYYSIRGLIGVKYKLYN